MTDEIELAGSQAWHSGKGESDCPYTRPYSGGDYWQSDPAKRQRWMNGFLRAWRQNEIMMSRRTWPVRPCMWEEHDS